MDLPADQVRLSKVEVAIPLLSLETGHVGVPIRFPTETTPVVCDAAIARAVAGAEVTACDETVEQRLGQRSADHATLAVGLRSLEDSSEDESSCS